MARVVRTLSLTLLPAWGCKNCSAKGSGHGALDQVRVHIKANRTHHVLVEHLTQSHYSWEG